jgi:hypothetical protein
MATQPSPKEPGGLGLGYKPEILPRAGLNGPLDGRDAVRDAKRRAGNVPDAATVNTYVGISLRSDGGFGLQVKLVVSMPGVDRTMTEWTAERGNFIGPYLQAAEGDTEVLTEIV